MTYYPPIDQIWLASDNIIYKIHQPWTNMTMNTHSENFEELRENWLSIRQWATAKDDFLNVLNAYLDTSLVISKKTAFYGCNFIQGRGRLTNIRKASANCQLIRVELVFDHDGLPIALASFTGGCLLNSSLGRAFNE